MLVEPVFPLPFMDKHNAEAFLYWSSSLLVFGFSNFHPPIHYFHHVPRSEILLPLRRPDAVGESPVGLNSTNKSKLIHPTAIRFSNPFRQWLYDSILMTTVHDTDNGPELDMYQTQSLSSGYPLLLGPSPPDDSKRHVLRLNTRHVSRGYWKILDSGETIEPFTLMGEEDSPGIVEEGALYLIIHDRCIQLVERFIEKSVDQNTFHIHPEDEISSIKQLWQVMHRRMPGCHIYMPKNELPDPFEYYGGRGCRQRMWEDDEMGDGEVRCKKSSLSMKMLTVILVARGRSIGDTMSHRIRALQSSAQATSGFE